MRGQNIYTCSQMLFYRLIIGTWILDARVLNVLLH
jgi:hypothetical protein